MDGQTDRQTDGQKHVIYRVKLSDSSINTPIFSSEESFTAAA